MFRPSRSQARSFLFTAWEKYRAGAPLSELERIAVDIIAQHPEYHSLLEAPEEHADQDFSPDDGVVNPFLHLSLHLAIAEQLATDRPQGICAEFDRLARKHVERHAALHAMLDCLGETIWQSQRTANQPDPSAYLDCVRRK